MSTLESERTTTRPSADGAVSSLGRSTRFSQSTRFGRRGRAFGRSSNTKPQVSRYQDHFSLQAPTSVVRFQDSKSAARVIFNNNSQLVLEDTYDEDTKRRRVTIKQMSEEAGGALSLLRLSYTLVGLFFSGFLFVFMMQLMLFVVLDLTINLGLTDMQDASYVFAVGVLFALPVLVHGASLSMMLAWVFVKDLWTGHFLFKKYVLPGQSDEVIEWIFLIGLLLLPLFCIGSSLIAKPDTWWAFSSLVWFFCAFAFYMAFLLSVLWYEMRLYFNFVHDTDIIDDYPTFLGRVWACIMLRERHTWSGYERTNYASYGAPDTALSEKSHDFIVEGTLVEHQRSIYSRFSQWSLLEGRLFHNLETPQRIYLVDDVTAKRPYITAYNWNLETYFCRPKKTRYIRILDGPGAVTSSQIKSAVACSVVGVIVVYFLLSAVIYYQRDNLQIIGLVAIVMFLLCFPLILSPIKNFRELKKLQKLKRDNRVSNTTKQAAAVKQESHPDMMESGNNNNEVAYEQEVTTSVEMEKLPVGRDIGTFQSTGGSVRVRSMAFGEHTEIEFRDQEAPFENVEQSGDGAVQNEATEKTPPPLPEQPPPGALGADTEKRPSVQWSGFASHEHGASMGIYFVAEKYRITSPTPAFSVFMFALEFFFLMAFPTISLYCVESWQLATVYLSMALLVALRYHSNANLLLQETGLVYNPSDENDDAAMWRNQSRLGQIAATLSEGTRKGYYIWLFLFSLFLFVFVVLGVQATSVDPLENSPSEHFTLQPDFFYNEQKTLHYTSCEFDKDIEGVPPAELIDYMFLSALAYRTEEEISRDLPTWYGEGVVVERDEIVDYFKLNVEDKDRPVLYKLFTVEPVNTMGDKPEAIISIRGTHSPWDMLADLQLWGAAVLFQVVRSLIPFGYIFDPILDQMVKILSKLQSGTLEMVSFYKSTTQFANYLVESGNYSSVLLTGHSLGGGIAIISGAQAEIQAVAISGPNAMISRYRLGVTAENLERYTFNVKPDRDPVAMIDDPTKNLQRIECHGPKNDLIACHAITRSLCEAMYTCGTKERPVLCECVTMYGYPEPLKHPNSTISFAEACDGTGM